MRFEILCFFSHVLVDSVFTAPGPILMDLVVILGAIFDFLSTFPADAAKVKKTTSPSSETLVFEKARFPFQHVSGNLFSISVRTVFWKAYLIIFLRF